MLKPQAAKNLRANLKEQLAKRDCVPSNAIKHDAYTYDVVVRTKEDDRWRGILTPHLVVINDEIAMYLPIDRTILKKIKQAFEKELFIQKCLQHGEKVFVGGKGPPVDL